MTAPKWYDITVSRAKYDGTKEDLGKVFEALGAERYVIGEETGEDGYQHYQCRIVFKKEKDIAHLIKVFGPIGHVSPTHVRDFNYCEKEGVFYRSWEKALAKYADIELMFWQKQTVEELREQNDREVMVIIDEEGNKGKTWLRKYLQVTRMCAYIPALSDYKDLMRICMAKPSKGYCFDIPRADDIRKNKSIWQTIENIKDGYLFDDRYSYKEMWIDSPKVLIFTNDEPPTDQLSDDRWKIYRIQKFAGILQITRD